MEIWIIESAAEKVALYSENKEVIEKVAGALEGQDNKWIEPVRITESEMKHLKKAAGWTFVEL